MAVPLPGAVVTAFRYDSDEGKYVNEGSAVADDAGNYEIVGLPLGDYVVKFVGPPDEDAYLTRYQSGDESTLADATAVTLPEEGLTVDATLPNGAVISGVVQGEE